MPLKLYTVMRDFYRKKDGKWEKLNICEMCFKRKKANK